MPLLFTCPHCQSKTRVEDRYSGQSGECFQCGGEITLPAFAASPNRSRVLNKGTNRKVATWLIAVVVTGGLLLIVLTAVVRLGGSSMNQLTNNRIRSGSIRNLETIAKALNAYAEEHGRYPPPVIKDPNGVAMHSWRVMLLPYLQENELYNQYDRSKPWNDPDNLAIQYQIPNVYLHPESGGAGWSSASAYYLIAGNGTLFPVAGPLRPDEITDDASQTILLVEGMPMTTSGSWTEPIDLDFASVTGDLLSGSANEPGGLSDGGVTMATADGRGHFVPSDIEPATLRALVTPRGGERLADDTLD